MTESTVSRKKKKNYHHSEYYKDYDLQLMNLDTIID